MRGLLHDLEFSGRMAAGLLRRGRTVAAHPVRPRSPAVPQAANDRRRDKRPGLSGTAQQSLRELRGKLAGFCSIRVNSQWRLVFRWDGSRGEAEGIYLDDHSYR